jgi:hypothetical protein
MSLRPTVFTDTYTPGKKYGQTREVTVENIPGEEIVHDGVVTDVIMTFEVAERIDVLIDRALRANELPRQRITYTEPKRRRATAVTANGSLRHPRPAAATSHDADGDPGR